MIYSYTSPRKKSFFTKDFQLMFTFFNVTFFMLFATYLFLVFKAYQFDSTSQDIIQSKIEIRESIKKIELYTSVVTKEHLFSENIFTSNMVLKDSIRNLFDLVPNRITLSEAKLLENGLVLYGITPNEDVYNFMLAAPLRSVFNRTYSSFYPAQNGWLRFVSTNYADNEGDELNED